MTPRKATEKSQPESLLPVAGALGSYISPISSLLVAKGWEALDFQSQAKAILTSDLRGSLRNTECSDNPRPDGFISLPNAYLFTGPAGCGQEEAFLLLAATVHCGEPTFLGGIPDPCWRCDECRAALSGTHPDVVVVEPEGTTYLVDFVRDRVVAESKYSSMARGQRLVLLREAERLSRAASNALLRTIEEPPGRVTFVIAASPDRGAVLETVASRCREVPFYPIPPASLEILLIDGGADPDTAKAAVAASDGSLEGAARAMQASSYAEFTPGTICRLVFPLFYDSSANPLEISGMLREKLEEVLGGVRSSIEAEISGARKAEEEMRLEVSSGHSESLRTSKHRRLRRSEQALCLRVVTVIESLALIWSLYRLGFEDVARQRLEGIEAGLGKELCLFDRASELDNAFGAGKTESERLGDVVSLARRARASLALNPRLEVWLDELATELSEIYSPL